MIISYTLNIDMFVCINSHDVSGTITPYETMQSLFSRCSYFHGYLENVNNAKICTICCSLKRNSMSINCLYSLNCYIRLPNIQINMSLIV